MDNKLKVAYVDSLSAFCGINKILEKLGSFYYWPNLVSDVKNFINNCKVSKTTNYPNRTLCPPMGTLAKRIEEETLCRFCRSLPLLSFWQCQDFFLSQLRNSLLMRFAGT